MTLLLVYIFTILFIVILECTLSTYRKQVCCKTVLLCQQQPHMSRVYSGLLMEFSVVFDLISCWFVQ